MSEHEGAPPFGGEEWLEVANTALSKSKHKCPGCRRPGTLYVNRQLVAKPLGAFSLSGAQLKTSTFAVVVAHCSRCGWSGQVVG